MPIADAAIKQRDAAIAAAKLLTAKSGVKPAAATPAPQPQGMQPLAQQLEELAATGDALSQAQLGSLYAQGKGVPQDYAEAARWFRKAADQGQAGAQYQLGHLYYLGRGVPKDFVAAHMWSNLAAMKDGPRRDDFKKFRDEVASKLTPAQLAAAQAMSQRCLDTKYTDCGLTVGVQPPSLSSEGATP